MIRAPRLNGVMLIVFLLGAPGFVSGDEGAKPDPRTPRGVVVDESAEPVAGAEILANPFFRLL